MKTWQTLAACANASDHLPLSKTTVAAIQGDVYAGGMGLVAACDIAISVKNANFCLSEVKLGLIPATISPYVIRAMGARAAHRYFLTAEIFDAKEAKKSALSMSGWMKKSLHKALITWSNTWSTPAQTLSRV